MVNLYWCMFCDNSCVWFISIGVCSVVIGEYGSYLLVYLLLYDR